MASLYHHPIYWLRNSALPVILLWAGALAVLAYLELHGWAASWLLVLLTAPAALLALLHGRHALRRVSWAIKTSQASPVRFGAPPVNTIFRGP